MQEIEIRLYRWAGKWGPFKVNIPCGECTLTKDIIEDVLSDELDGIPVKLVVKDWLSTWWEPLPKGGWHAPIVMVNGQVVSQGAALNRGVLTEAVIKAWVGTSEVNGNLVYGKRGCPHCVRAKQALDQAGIDYAYFDVVKNPRALYEMVPRVKAQIGEKTPVTVPQIWLNGSYVGGAENLLDKIGDTEAVQAA